MKALVWTGKHNIEVQDIEAPSREAEEPIVKVKYTGICGSDLTIIAGMHPRAKTPLTLGHEFMGTVEWLPKQYKGNLEQGSRVAVNPLISCKVCSQCLKGKEHICENLKLIGVERNPGAFAEYVSIPQIERLFLVPEQVSDEEAALIEPAAVAIHAVEHSAIKPYESAVIFGAGPIGLLIAEVLTAYGITDFVVCEIDESRLRKAEECGFRTLDTKDGNIPERLKHSMKGRGADVVFEAAGVPATAELVISVAGIDARIIMVSIHKHPVSILFQQLSYKEQKIYGTRIYATDDFHKVLHLLSEKKIRLGKFISHVFDFKNVLSAFETAKSAQGTCKILVKQ